MYFPRRALHKTLLPSNCCVKGCKNNSNNKKKEPNAITSFHAFPADKTLKKIWLKAIGRPNWTPPNYARVCGVHFKEDNIKPDNFGRNRITVDAVSSLPPNSNFEASDVEVCRICLATDVKMHSLQSGLLKVCMETVTGFSDKDNNVDIGGLPQFVCYICAANFIKYYKFIEKSMSAQAILLDIFAQYGEITEMLVREHNKKDSSNMSSLSYSTVTVNITNFKHNENTTSLINNNSENIEVKEEDIFHNVNNFNVEDDVNYLANDLENSAVDEGKMDISTIISIDTVFNDHDYCNINEDKLSCEDVVDISSSDEEKQESLNKEEEVALEQLKINELVVKKKKKSHCVSRLEENIGLTRGEVKMRQYFKIVKLSLKEQIEEWKRICENGPWNSNAAPYKCETCGKMFVHLDTYKMHIAVHDPSRGSFECIICKMRVKDRAVLSKHINYIHGKKFYCKACPKVFNTAAVAKKHRNVRHAGVIYKCDKCEFSSRHNSSLHAHMRQRHANAYVCARCGRGFISKRGLKMHCAAVHQTSVETEEEMPYKCEECNVSFTTDGAKRVHLLTSAVHKNKKNTSTDTKDPSLKTACSRCGKQLSSIEELHQHKRTEHQGVGADFLPKDNYPTHCEHCGATISNRKEHWTHVRRLHPNETCHYRAVILAVCDICGKGFQNVTKLRLHVLRHRSPSVSCPSCPRLFYDKYALAVHAIVHSADKPYQCRDCGRAFNNKSNFNRHINKVHTEVLKYTCPICDKKFKYSSSRISHIRTVHYKIPYPPRKRNRRGNKPENEVQE